VESTRKEGREGKKKRTQDKRKEDPVDTERQEVSQGNNYRTLHHKESERVAYSVSFEERTSPSHVLNMTTFPVIRVFRVRGCCFLFSHKLVYPHGSCRHFPWNLPPDVTGDVFGKKRKCAQIGRTRNKI
jgi:hypothetical protein